MRIAIVEDDAGTREQLKAYIRKYFQGDQALYSLREFSDGDEILENYTADYDLIFLDIQMARLDGMETAEQIRRVDENVFLIFVTNLANYAIRGYSVQALDFVLKPVNYIMLERLLKKAEKLLERSSRRYITLPTDQGLSRIDVSRLLYVSTEGADGHMLAYHAGDEVYHYRQSMRNAEETLQGYGFYRCNSCYLVNLAHVVKATHETALLSDGEQLSVSRARYKGFMEELTAYLRGAR